MFTKLSCTALLTLALTVTTLAASADEPNILTISGAIETANRAPSSEDDATMLGAHDIAFEKGFAVDRDTLAGLPQLSYPGRVPNSDADVLFTGPLIADVLDLAGASGDTITLTALDGYGVEIERAYIDEHKPILAISADGVSFDIGDKGPAVSVFPLSDDPELAEAFAARQIWALFHIRVE